MGTHEEPTDPSAKPLAAIDEILQVMYWLRGENIASAVAPSELAASVGLEVGELASLLDRMAGAGLVEEVEASSPDCRPRYALTGSGVLEGGRRFADEFAEFTRQAHGQCSDPDCQCRRTGNPEDCSHGHVGEVVP